MKPYYGPHNGVTIYHGDCRDVMDDFALHFGAKAFDILHTDPPYGIGAAKAKSHSSIRDSSKWESATWDDVRRPDALLRAVAITKRQAVWGGNFYADILPPTAGWLAWIKPEAETGFSLADMELCWTSEAFAARVKHAPRRDGNSHPTQKPLTVMAWSLQVLKPSSVSVVFDPFMGSGTTLVAAKNAGLAAVGIDTEERYCEIAAKRLSQEVLSFA